MTRVKHITTKKNELNIKLRSMYWLLGRKSQLSLENKILLYKSIIKPIWTYGVQLWGSASASNLNIIQRIQSKTIRTIVNAPWYVSNATIHNDLRINTVREEIKKLSINYLDRIHHHRNQLGTQLLDRRSETRRLKRHKPLDLPHRF